jgi:hypothetical protein
MHKFAQVAKSVLKVALDATENQGLRPDFPASEAK